MEEEILTAYNTNYLSYKCSGCDYIAIWQPMMCDYNNEYFKAKSKDDALSGLYEKIKDKLEFLED